MHVARRHVVLSLLSLFGCNVSNESLVRSAEPVAYKITVALSDNENPMYLSVAIPSDDQAVTVTLDPIGTAIPMQATSTLVGDRRIFRSVDQFQPQDDMALLMKAEGAAPAQQKIIFKLIAKPSDADNGGGLKTPQLGTDGTRKLTVVGTAKDGLSKPRALAFNPESPSELWIVNQTSESVVIIQNAGQANQQVEQRKDAYADHFMAQVSSLAFGANGTFATCQESRNEAHPYLDFMGPTLWPSDRAIFAKVNQNFVDDAQCNGIVGQSALQGSHLDMLHQSPLCMGIAHAEGNAYWTFDGQNGDLVYYDFVKDHGPGGSDHRDGRVRRYTDVKLQRTVGVPSHMAVDKNTGFLYIADTGTGRVLQVDTRSAKKSGRLTPDGETLAEYSSYQGAKVVSFVEGLRQPSGIAIASGKLFVSDYATGEIFEYDLTNGDKIGSASTGATKIMGLAIDASNKIWFVDGGANTVVRIDP